ncbi:hypothetical protein Thiowin_04121 [Thiorhodovibrio winogradskyi]|uniref:Uncharacterized protein n=2 Tax=Thiorhodovibrio winogradskyi TaxID=77007 RepID=A0ABZ0SFW1_9GAMM
MKSSVKTGHVDHARSIKPLPRENEESRELEAISRTVHRLQSDPQALQLAMQKAGILTQSGQLAEDYRS